MEHARQCDRGPEATHKAQACEFAVRLDAAPQTEKAPPETLGPNLIEVAPSNPVPQLEQKGVSVEQFHTIGLTHQAIGTQ